jgi:hypothetical protein
MAIWQDLVADTGFSGSYQSLKRFVRKLRGTQPAQARAVIVTAPGEEAQADYGSKGPMVRDAQTGKYRRTRLFVMTLGYSRKSVRLLTFRSSSRIWAELHEKAFRRLGGSPRVVVLDNLKEGVLVPDVYDPTLNPLYRDVLAHYGAVALPCRIQDPDRKGDAKRRQMRYVLWTLLATLVPYAIGMILYFILRDPLPKPCPGCGHVEKAKFRPHCGTLLQPTCPKCDKPVEPTWANCAYCGQQLPEPAMRATQNPSVAT